MTGTLAVCEQIKKHQNGERLHRFLVGVELCAVNTVICEGEMVLPGEDRGALILWLCPSREMLRVKKMLGCE